MGIPFDLYKDEELLKKLSKKLFCIGGAVNDLPRRRPSQLLVGLGISGEQRSGKFRQIPSGKLSQLRLNVSRS